MTGAPGDIELKFQRMGRIRSRAAASCTAGPRIQPIQSWRIHVRSLLIDCGEIMQKRTIGRSELRIAPLMFGGNVFGWTADEATSFSILDAFVDAGLDFIDTADVYSAWVPGNHGGESESIIGKWFRQSGKRDRIVLATKVSKHPQRKGLSAANIQAAVEDSLRRLQTDYIDIYF